MVTSSLSAADAVLPTHCCCCCRSPPRLQLTLLLLLLLLLQALHLLHEPRHGAALCCRVLLELLDAEYERLVLLRQAADLRM
jgi:hypothetical protein